ncbi:MAG TPA: hypothetical protein VJQ82_26165 [Terriglobales bacterium]|nr:hypothetical protein [Terriglobales bacterium]
MELQATLSFHVNRISAPTMARNRTPEFFAVKNLKFGIIGCSNVELPLALDKGDSVLGCNLSHEKVEKLNCVERRTTGTVVLQSVQELAAGNRVGI